MPKQKWLELFYTYDYDGNFMKLGECNGQIFPHNVKNKLFDMRLLNGIIHLKCLVISLDNGITATAITQDGDFIKLDHGVHLRINPDSEIQKKLEKIFRKRVVKDITILRIKRIKTELDTLAKRKSQLTTELLKLERELATEEDVS